ncbi:hypothetical protein B0H17DRAFT_1198644 [Mycena rosella]|uniref:Uncharacterized protein n=1 Tax=Mycena rosella TaxID=1033263 RepID=A0AAD7DNH8_MYCRO|nr:hypothetical protein B0H17DRAFT_1198644 [Mycena rosella]
MQTRRQAAQAAALAAAAAQGAVVQPVANVPPPPPAPLQESFSWGSLSSLSTLTPSSSFASDTGTATTGPNGVNLGAISEGDEDEDADVDEVPNVYGTAFGVPRFVRLGPRALLTPTHSQSDRYPAEVFETPRKNHRPTEEEQRAARQVRDSELAKSGGLARLTRHGTLIYPDDSFAGPSDYKGGNLGSAFMSTRSIHREQTRTRLIDPSTGRFLDESDSD